MEHADQKGSLMLAHVMLMFVPLPLLPSRPSDRVMQVKNALNLVNLEDFIWQFWQVSSVQTPSCKQNLIILKCTVSFLDLT